MRLLSIVPPAVVVVFTTICMIPGLKGEFLQVAAPAAAALAVGAVLMLQRQSRASPVHKAMAAFMVLAALAVLLGPGAAGWFVTSYPAPCLYAVLFVMAAGPAMLGREVFTLYFAKGTAPEAAWHTEEFAAINRNLAWFWAGLFMLCTLSGFAPLLLKMRGAAPQALFQGLIPALFMLGAGIPMNRRYPAYYMRRLAPGPVEKQAQGKTEEHEDARGPGSAKSCRELLRMMPQGFSPAAANGLRAVYQFEVSGGEVFTAHLRIDRETCIHVDGPAERPDVVVKTPADVWLAVSKGEMDGQAALMSGKFKVEGDLSLLLKLRALFPG